MSENRIYGLDLVRSIAISLVLLLHASDAVKCMPIYLKDLFSIGWAGVDIFFVLSGFLIGSQISKNDECISIRKRLYNFWVKRWFRTLPLYLAVFFTYIVIKPILGWSFNDSIFKYFVFLQNYFSPKDFVQSWSLCIEEQFYVIFPIIIFTFSSTIRKSWIWLMPILISICARYYIITNNQILSETSLSYLIRFPTYSHMDGIALGVYIAFTKDMWHPIVSKNTNKIFILSLMGLFGSLVYFGNIPLGYKAIFFTTILSIFSAGLVMSGYFLKLPKYTEKIVYYPAILSYGLYLWNNLFIRISDHYFKNFNWVIGTFLFLFLTFLISIISYNLIEKPFMSIRKRILRKGIIAFYPKS